MFFFTKLTKFIYVFFTKSTEFIYVKNVSNMYYEKLSNFILTIDCKSLSKTFYRCLNGGWVFHVSCDW
jgi:hypothetical protein